MPWIKCTEEAYKKCPFSNICGDAENAIFMGGSDCDKFNQSLNPYTVDAVPVVRCGKCIFYDPESCSNRCRHPKGLCNPGESDFCSYGRTQEGE